MEKHDNIPEYGDPKYIFTLGWKDESKKDELVVIDYQLKSEVMNARAKGTRVYELIDIYGGVDKVSEAFSAKNNGVYADVSNYPQFSNDEEMSPLLEQLQKEIDDLKAKQAQQQAQQQPAFEKGGAEEK